MITNKDNIILIGMPGCGKSSLGVVLAKALGYEFVDLDLIIQQRENMLLQEIIEEKGLGAFRKIEEEIGLAYKGNKTIVATGGSMVYSEAAMKHLKKIGVVIYIKLPWEEISKRICNLEDRGIVMDDNKTLEDIYEERIPLYEKFAEITVETEGLDIRNSVELIKKEIKKK